MHGAQGARRWAAVRRTTFGARIGFALDPPRAAGAAPAEGIAQGTRTARSIPRKVVDDSAPALGAAGQPERTGARVDALDPSSAPPQLLPEGSQDRVRPLPSLDRGAPVGAAAEDPDGREDSSAEPRPKPWQAPDGVQAYEQACQDARAPVSVRVRALLGTPCAKLGACRLGRVGAAAVAAALRAPGDCLVRRLMLAHNDLDAMVRLLNAHPHRMCKDVLLVLFRALLSEGNKRCTAEHGGMMRACSCLLLWCGMRMVAVQGSQSNEPQVSVRDVMSMHRQLKLWWPPKSPLVARDW